jgi:hypothetical protein
VNTRAAAAEIDQGADVEAGVRLLVHAQARAVAAVRPDVPSPASWIVVTGAVIEAAMTVVYPLRWVAPQTTERGGRGWVGGVGSGAFAPGARSRGDVEHG